MQNHNYVYVPNSPTSWWPHRSWDFLPAKWREPTLCSQNGDQLLVTSTSKQTTPTSQCMHKELSHSMKRNHKMAQVLTPTTHTCTTVPWWYNPKECMNWTIHYLSCATTSMHSRWGGGNPALPWPWIPKMQGIQWATLMCTHTAATQTSQYM